MGLEQRWTWIHIPLVTFVQGALNGLNAVEVSQCSLCILAFSLVFTPYLSNAVVSAMYSTCIYTVPVIKKLKYSTAGTERVRSRFARGSLEVRSWCANRYGAGAVRCGAHALRSYAGATPIVYAYILTAVENYPLLRVVGEDHLDHDQISHLGHVNTRCATIRSQYRIAPRRLTLYRAYRARAPHRAHRTVPHRTAPAYMYMYTLLSRFARRSVLIRYCFGTASVLLRCGTLTFL